MAEGLERLILEEADVDLNPEADDSDTFDCAPAPANNLSQRHRAKKAIFASWLASDAGQRALEPNGQDESNRDETETNELSSIATLMSKQESQRIIRSPRDYQIELFERAKKENTIAVLGTGTGKTLIAGLLLEWVIDQELEDRSAGKPPRISFFLVETVALALQQFRVLQNNLDHKIIKICGDDGPDAWPKEKWLEVFNTNKVVVCTAEILRTCLARNYCSMRQINLIILDEAHHAHGKHPYAQIMKNYYSAESASARPKVFGMTASPIDAKADVNLTSSALEARLNAKIATALAGDIDRKPLESTRKYAALPEPFATPLLQRFKAQFSHITVFEDIFKKVPNIARELGQWCADRYLVDSLIEKRLPGYEARMSKTIFGLSLNNTHALDQQLLELESAAKFLQGEDQDESGTSFVTGFSSKVQELIDLLSHEFETSTARRSIVFVEQRSTAILLTTLFVQLHLLPHLHCAYLIGSNSGFDEERMSLRDQVLTLKRFREGEINCLFATSVAEEGLDVQDCNLVIRFDLYKTMIQYVQSRGRARQRGSKFIHMIEIGNSVQKGHVQDARYHEMKMLQFCQSLPNDRKLLDSEDTLETLAITRGPNQYYVDPDSGAILDLDNALVTLATFVSTLSTESNEPLHPAYIVSAKGSKFEAEVILPSSSPIRFKVGELCSRKALARQSAAFMACKALKDAKHLNKHFQPMFRKRIPALAHARLAVGMHKKAFYAMRQKPCIWEHMRGALPTELWLTIIDFPDGLEKKHQPLVLLTRTRLSEFPEFPVILSDDRSSRVQSRQLEQSLQIDESMLTRLSDFTFRIYQDIFRKRYEYQPEKLSYWLAPAVFSCLSELADTNPGAAIDWSLLELIHENMKYPWTEDMTSAFLIDRYMFDELEAGRTYRSTAVEPSLKPFDPVPAYAVKSKRAERNTTILGYSDSIRKRTRNIDRWNPNQPVLRAELLTMRRDMLAPPTAAQKASQTLAFICPEPLAISVLPMAIVEACLVLPSVIHRFESYMIAREACQMLGIDCGLELALAAVTKDSDNSDEHEHDERINFQHGMGENYERLEFIGDTFLKTATTISTYVRNPTDTEYEFHCTRMGMLCNKNLYLVAKESKLYEYIRSKSMSRNAWQQEDLKLLEGKTSRDKPEHNLGQKTIADVCEALIGAAFVAHDKPDEDWQEERWNNAVHAVTKLVGSPNHEMETWNDYRKAYTIPEYQTSHVTASQRDMAAKVELKHPYHFKYPPLLRSAFTHPSQLRGSEKGIPNYQQLEFLGDALLDMACITHLFYRFPDKDPQWLTEHKMAMVSNKFLGALCVSIGFHKHLRFGHNLAQQISDYADELEEAERKPGADRDYWTSVSDPPKCLPDIVESYVGAMFIDSGFDYTVVRNFFNNRISWYFEDMSIYDTFANNHPCTHLYNLLQSAFGCRDFELLVQEVSTVGTELSCTDVAAGVVVHNEVVGFARGKSGRYARIRAAKSATEKLEGLAAHEFRSAYGCICRLDEAVVDRIAACGA